MPDTVSAENEQQQRVSLLSLPSHSKSSEARVPRAGVAAWLARHRKWVLLGIAAALIALIVPLAVILPRKRSHRGQLSDLSPPFTILIENLVDPNVVGNTPAYLLLHTASTYDDANTACGNLGETLASTDESASILSLLASYNGRSDTSQVDRFWVDNQGNNACTTHSLSANTTEALDCSSVYPGVCTNTASLLSSTSQSPTDTSVVVNTSYGMIRGFRDRLTARFRGIPYAMPPVGELRFQAPQNITGLLDQTGWVYDATYFRSVCPQQGTPQVAKTVGMSEDCLHLNIYTPSIPGGTSAALLPVVVFIHGGSYVSGSGSSISYEAMNLASRESLVVVSIEYRLGFLGFYSGPSGSNSSNFATNQAMRDQIKALQWVQEEIRSFGGDPNQVTIYGQSAGATSVLSLVQTNATAGLFARAIADSPNLLPGWQRPEINQDLADLLLSVSGCSDADCLRYNRTSEQIMTYQGQVFRQAQNTFPPGKVNGIEPVRPFIDNDLITQDWDTALLSGAVNRVPTLISYNHDEYGSFLSLKSPVSFSAAENLLNTSLIGTERMQQILTTPELGFNTSLENASDGVDEALITFLTDFTYRCNSEIYAGYLQTVHPDVWEMTWEMGLAQLTNTAFCKPSTNRTCHGTELAMVFGSAGSSGGLSTKQLSSIDYWQRTRDSLDLYGGFARQGNLTLNGTAYPRRGGGGDDGTTTQQHNVLHWNDHPQVHPGGVNWDRCAKMQSMRLYDRLFYPYDNATAGS